MSFLKVLAATKPIRFVARHSNLILPGLACAGVVATAATAIDGTRRAIPRLEEMREKYGDIKDAPKGELAKTLAVPYIPMITTAGFTLAFIIVGARMNAKKIATLTSLYTGQQILLKDYQKAVEDRFGKDKANEVKDKLIKERLDNSKVPRPPIPEESEVMLCYDADNDRYLYTNRTKLERAVDEFNRHVDIFTARTIDEFYNDIGLGSSTGSEMLMVTPDNKLKLHYAAYLVEGTRPVLSFAIDSVLISADGSKKRWPKRKP